MNKTTTRMVALMLCICLILCGCGETDANALAEQLLTSISENEDIQNWLAAHDWQTMTQEALDAFKESYPVLKEFLAREDVQETFKEVGLPLIEEFLSYSIDSMKLKAQTLADIIRIFAPELTEQVDAIFETAEHSQ